MKAFSLPLSIGIAVLAMRLSTHAELPIPAGEPASDGGLKMLQSSNYLERSRAIRVLSQQREKMIHNLIVTLNGQYDVGIRLDAARALGAYRTHEAVQALIDNWPLEEQERQIAHGLVTDEEFAAMMSPISTALKKIGSPAIPALITCIATNADIKIQGKALKVLCKIDGDKDISTLRLQKAIKAETDAQKQTRLQAALKALIGS